MTASEKRRVRLADVRPDPNNPRKDFGDISALASSIEATGGEPVNPIVVVRDGASWRIVDGERRYRAMSELHAGDEGFECDAIAFADVSDAHAMVAMLATDDKQRLTDEERARGVQEMLALGVDEEVVSKASRVGRDKVGAVRRMRALVPEGEQVTIDQLVAADSLGDELDAETVLSSGRDWYAVAKRIERERKHERVDAEVRDAAADAGVEVVETCPEGFSYEAQVSTAAGVAALPADAVLMRVTPGNWCAYAPRREDAAARERERLRTESAAAVRESVLRMASWLGGLLMRPDCAELAPLRARCLEARELSDDAGVADALVPDASAAPASAWEMATLAHGELMRVVRRGVGLVGWDGTFDRWACEAYLDAYGLARDCGWEPTEGDSALAAQAERREEAADEQG